MLTRRALSQVGAAIAVFALAFGLSACASTKPDLVPSDVGVEPVVTVYVADNRYEPAQVEIKVGQAVRWEFVGAMEHDVVAVDGSFVSELQATGEYIHVFDEVGEYGYDCSIHPEMIGMVIVR